LSEISLPGTRLAAVASFVEPGARICDVGSDHAKLPVWLFQKKIIRSAVLTDISKPPLLRAEECIRQAGFSGRAEFFLCDGLEKVDPSSFDTLIVSGMGGETIRSIVDAAPWLRKGYSLILQPNSGEYELREYLCENGYEIVGGRLAREGHFFYGVLNVRGGSMALGHVAHLHAGAEFVRSRDPLFPAYADYLIRGFKLAAKGLSAAKGDNSARINELSKIVAEIERMKGEVENALC